MRTIKAQYPGECCVCGKGIARGDLIEYEKGHPIRHAACQMPDIPADAIHLSDGSGYGVQGWTPGEVIVNPRGAEPPFLYVLTASSRYVREDGLSFGVGDESGYIYEAVCRAATDEEAAPLRIALAEQQKKQEAEKRRRALAEQIKSTGERPDGKYQPEGHRITDRQNIYGGGDWFVLGTEHVWYVLNNGHDGDDWSANNVRTGGAGAIGWRVARAGELERQLLSIEAVLDPTTQKRRDLQERNALGAAAYQKHCGGRLDDTIWGNPVDTTKAVPRIPFVTIVEAETEPDTNWKGEPVTRIVRHPILAGVGLAGEVWLATKYENCSREYDVYSFLDGEYAFALCYEGTLERLAAINARLPEWCTPHLLETYRLAWAAGHDAGAKENALYDAWKQANPEPPYKHGGTKEENAAWMSAHKAHDDAKMAEFGKIDAASKVAASAVWNERGELVGRFRLRERGFGIYTVWADNARDALFRASIDGIPLDALTYTPDVTLVHTHGKGGAGPWQLWNDGAITTGNIAACAYPKSLSEAASELIAAAAREGWDKVEVLALQAVQSIDRVTLREDEGRNEKRKLEQLNAHFASGQPPRTFYLLTVDWWYLGEDGDAGTDLDLFKDKHAAESAFRGKEAA